MYNSKQTVSLFLISAIIWWEQIKCHEEFLLTVIAMDTVFSAIVTCPVNIRLESVSVGCLFPTCRLLGSL